VAVKWLVLAALSALACSSSESDGAPPEPPDIVADSTEWARWPMPNPASADLPNPQRYSITGDEIRDDVTRLVWWKEAEQGGRAVSFDEAQPLCEGHGDGWRLPTAIELVSLIDFTQTSPTIASEVGSPLQYFWTSSLLAGDSTRAWTVYFGDGHSSDGTITARDSVRCVREPARETPTSRYERDSSFGVNDVLTGLVWEEPSSFLELDFAGAEAYCAELGARVPSMKELQTLVDRGRVSPSIDVDRFPDTPSAPFWTSSLVAGNPDLAWSVSFELGRSDQSGVTSEFSVRCVR
jgi:hypothetical protein